jgi:hypothetical protein
VGGHGISSGPDECAQGARSRDAMHFDRLMHSNALPHARDAESSQTRGQKPGEVGSTSTSPPCRKPCVATPLWGIVRSDQRQRTSFHQHIQQLPHPESLSSCVPAGPAGKSYRSLLESLTAGRRYQFTHMRNRNNGRYRQANLPSSFRTLLAAQKTSYRSEWKDARAG